MNETSEDLRRKIDGAADLSSVVRTMKALAGSRIGQYQNAVLSLQAYYHTIELGLLAFLQRQTGGLNKQYSIGRNSKIISVIVLGSDQGLIGQFNDTLSNFAIKTMAKFKEDKNIIVVGDRIRSRLEETGAAITRLYQVPHSIQAITPLVSNMLLDAEANHGNNEVIPLYIFYNQPLEGSTYEPIYEKILPLDGDWEHQFMSMKWPAKNIPEILGIANLTFEALVREYLFVSLFKACASSLTSENASRLAAMQRAEKNINKLLTELNQNFHRIRQNKIDEELFDVIAGFEAIK